jgi:hypothetical protein
MTRPVYESANRSLRGARCLAILISVAAAALIVTGAVVAQSAGRAPLTLVVLGGGATAAVTPSGISCPMLLRSGRWSA